MAQGEVSPALVGRGATFAYGVVVCTRACYRARRDGTRRPRCRYLVLLIGIRDIRVRRAYVRSLPRVSTYCSTVLSGAMRREYEPVVNELCKQISSHQNDCMVLRRPSTLSLVQMVKCSSKVHTRVRYTRKKYQYIHRNRAPRPIIERADGDARRLCRNLYRRRLRH